MTDVEVWVAIGGRDVRAGTLHTRRRGRAETATLRYEAAYLEDPDAYALDPLCPLSLTPARTGAGTALFGSLSDCCPDRWGRTLIARAERRAAAAEDRDPRSFGEVDILLGVRDDLRQGALRFRTSAGGPFVAEPQDGVPELTALPELLALADRADGDDATYMELLRLVRAGSSLGGARPKAHVVDLAGRVSIAKLPSASQDTWDVMAWEKVALDLAGLAGIAVPASRLHRVGGRGVLVVERFDRGPPDDEGPPLRTDYRSAMTLCERRDGDTGSYLEIAEVIEEHAPTATRDLAQLWRRMAFSVLITNVDDHLRNHGFLHAGKGSWQLAPAFDLNPNPLAPALLATALDEVRTEASVGLLLEVAPWFRLERAAALAVLGDVSEAVASWRRVASAAGLGVAAQRAMAPAFEHQRARDAAALVS